MSKITSSEGFKGRNTAWIFDGIGKDLSHHRQMLTARLPGKQGSNDQVLNHYR